MNKTPWQTYTVQDNEKIHGFFGDYRWLSNFHYAPIWDSQFHFPTNEHTYQFAKLPLNEWKPERYEEIIKLKPYETKIWIREIGLRPDWEKVKYDVMLGINFAKYYQNKDLRKLLLKTKNAHLEETNAWHDNIWGNCVCPRCANIEGANLLGKILMKTREFLR